MAKINLIPDAIVGRQLRRVHLRRASFLAGAAMLLLLTAAAFDGWDQARVRKLQAHVIDAESRVGQMRQEVQKLAVQADDLQLRIQRADALRSKRAWSSVLALLSRALPNGCWLTSVATVPPRPGRTVGAPTATLASKPEGKTRASMTIDAPRKLTLTGYAGEDADPVKFVTRLKESGAFREVTLMGTRRETLPLGPYFHFEVVCEW